MAEFNFDDTTSWDAEDVRRQRAAFQFSEEENNRQREREARERARERVAARKRRRQRNRWIALGIKVPLYLVFVLASSALLAEWGWMLASDFCAFDQGDRRTASVVVTMDDNVRDVSEKLYDAGLIKYRWFFRLFARFAHAETKIGAGVYELNTDMDYQALIRGMRNSSGSMTTEQVRITIPEGYNVRDIISLLAKNGVATREELEDAARTADFQYDFIDNESEDINRLEGYLFPDTYDFFKPERPVSALNKLLANFERKQDGWEGELAYAQTRGYDLHKIVTIASLIEKETDGTDQARIASVIYNRLDGPGDKAGTYGLLQIDAALLYALPDHTGPITSQDLEASSAYNLYKNPGLPPTPIANPGAKCIEAALTPESTDYYYYALAKDGKHRFFTNYREFSDFLSSGDYIGN